MARDISFPIPFVDAVRAPGAPVAAKLRAVLLTLFREKPADDEIERYIQDNGGVLTDQLEREISRHFGHPVR